MVAPVTTIYDFTEIKRTIKKGKVPEGFKNYVLPYELQDDSIILAHRALPVIKKYSPDGKLIQKIDIREPEFQSIKTNFFEKNKTLPPNIFFPLQYWSDIAGDSSGHVYLLLYHLDKTIILKVNKNGETVTRFSTKDMALRCFYIEGDNLWGFDRESGLHRFALSH